VFLHVERKRMVKGRLDRAKRYRGGGVVVFWGGRLVFSRRGSLREGAHGMKLVGETEGLERTSPALGGILQRERRLAGGHQGTGLCDGLSCFLLQLSVEGGDNPLACTMVPGSDRINAVTLGA